MKTKIMIISVIVVMGVIFGSIFIKGLNHKDTNYPATVSATSFSPEGDQIKLGISSAVATKDTLTVSLTISGLDLSKGPASVSDLVCVPYILTKENVGIEFKSLDVFAGNPNKIDYTYTLSGNVYRTLNIDMDWTIGPCGTALNESNVTPVPEPLMTNYHFTFSVPVK